uniref:Glycoside hydrolase family 5 domain-containing protein n=1 Tax=Bionectria ochroleuca TaxID=29856 RepID=A0A8H7K450_BIOOC
MASSGAVSPAERPAREEDVRPPHSLTSILGNKMVWLSGLALAALAVFLGHGSAAPNGNCPRDWPYAPFKTEGRDIVNAKGDKVKFAGVNWPMSGESMIPEGLEKKSASDILDDVAGLGMNFLRMGYSAQMVDEIYQAGGEDVSLEKAIIAAMGEQNGTSVVENMIKHNPKWTRETGRFEIWSDIVKLAAERHIYVHPDMHIAKAGWCCGHADGSAWFGDEDFSVANWTRALSYVADWAAQHDNIVSMALVNELRQPWVENYPKFGYNWMTLVGNMTLGSDAIHDANPDLLISWSGLQFDEDLSALTSGTNLLSSPCYMCVSNRQAPTMDPVVFNLADHAWADKVFYELHLYTMTEDLDMGSCGIIKAQLYRAGFNALGMDPPEDCALLENHWLGPCRPASRLTPVAMTEFGTAQDTSLLSNAYIQCLREFTTENDVSWAVWALAGSYRVRSGKQEVDDTWALYDFNWDNWRFQEGIDKVWKPWVKATIG